MSESRKGGNGKAEATQASQLLASLRWALDYIADGAAEDQTPRHHCEFISHPPAGACEFHDRYWAARDALHEAQFAERSEAK